LGLDLAALSLDEVEKSEEGDIGELVKVDPTAEGGRSRRRAETAAPCQEMEALLRRRTRSLNAPSPIQQFGPCGRIMKNSAMVMTIQDPASQRLTWSSQRLTWYKPPLTVLVIKKVRDAMVIPPFIALCKWFINQKRMVVFVESWSSWNPLSWVIPC